MELQKFINENSDYIKKIRKNDISVKIDKNLNLALIKYDRKKKDKYNFEENPWIDYCKGAIVDISNNKVICVPPRRSHNIEESEINNIVENYNSDNVYQPLIDGTMINMFYKNDQWITCTRSNIGALNTWDGKIRFKDLFTDINGTSWFDKLDKDKCYSFVFQHIKNRIVTPISNNIIYLIHSYKISGEYPERCSELPEIDGIKNIFSMTKEDVNSYNESPLYYSIKGLNIISNDKRMKWINPEFNNILLLKPNNNNKFLNYMELCNNGRLSEYVYYFPEDQKLFTEYYHKYLKLKNDLLVAYINKNIKKIKVSSENYIFKPLIYELHGQYLKTREKITDIKVDNYLKSMPGPRLLFLINRL